MIIVGIIAVLAAIAVPNFINSRGRSRQRTCQTNLRVIDQAKYQFAFEHAIDDGGTVNATDLTPNYIRAIPSCPSGGTYTINVLGTAPTCTQNTGSYPHVAQ